MARKVTGGLIQLSNPLNDPNASVAPHRQASAATSRALAAIAGSVQRLNRAAVAGVRGAGHVRGLLGTEKRDHRTDFVGRRELAALCRGLGLGG